AQNPRFGDDVDLWLGARLHGSNFSETSLYLGWLTIALALAFVVWALVRRSRVPAELRFATILLSATVVTGLAFSLPSPVVGEAPGPVQLIWEVAPQFRVPSRFVALAITGLLPLAALSLDRIASAVSRRSPPRMALAAAAAVCGLAGLISFLELSISPPAQMTDVGSMPREYSALHRSPPGTVAEYPLASSEHGITSDYLFYRRAHGRRLLNGAPPGTFSDTLRQTLVDPTTPGTAEGLAALGVSAIVVRPNVYGFTGGPAAPPADLGRGYRRLATSPSGNTVWRVSARPAPAIAGFGSGFYASETPAAGSTMRWMGSIGTVELFARRAGTYRATFSAGAYGKPRVITIESAEGSRQLFVQPVQRPQSLVLQLPVGRSRLTLTATPEAEPIPDGRRASTYVSNWRLEPVRPPTGQRPLASSRVSS
ncbi:MAG: hypothetical protein ACRDKU_08825, partial [Gaiellaceae bacterium]